MNLRSDPRYTVTREYRGHPAPRYVVRFCGDWVSSHSTKGAALTRAVGEACRRRGALVITEQPAHHVTP